MILALIGIVLAGVALLVVIGIAMAILGAVFGLVFGALALMVKALPWLVIGYFALKLVRRSERPRRRYIGADAQWLDR